MPTNTRTITYRDALHEAIDQEMEKNPSVFVYGIETKMFGSLKGLEEKFGKDRMFITPLSEEAATGLGLGAAMNGLRPIHVHIRTDFFLLAMNQLMNMMANVHYGSAGALKVPMVIRLIIGRGWGQGFQHSKSLHSMFAHIPGLKVIMPTTPYDAKGLMTAAIRDNNPVISIEHRWLYWQEGLVPRHMYEIPLGKGNILRKGSDVTIVATSWMNVEAAHAARILEKRGISVEIVDPRTIFPLDEKIIVDSVNKTGHCVVADIDWLFCGFSAEVAARVSEQCFKKLKKPVVRIGFAPTPIPTTRPLEDRFYPNAATIVRAVEKMFGLSPTNLSKEEFYSHTTIFKGPF